MDLSNFFTTTVISGVACWRGWKGGRGWGGWATNTRLYYLFIRTQAACSAVSLIGGRNRHNPQDRLIVIGSSLAPLTSLIILFTGSTIPLVHLYGFTWLIKCHLYVKADLNIYSHVFGVSGSTEVLLYCLAIKLNFSACTI